MKTRCRTSEQLERELADRIGQRSDAGWRADLCRCVPRFAALIDDAHGRPAPELEHAVRGVVMNECLTGAGRVSHDQAQLDRHVRLVVAAMEHARRAVLRNGEWDDAPVPPQMFG